MRRFYRLRSFECPPDGLLLAGLIIGVLGGSASAEERFVVKRDGRKVRIVRSESELAVTLKERGKGDATRLRMAADGTGMVADVPWAIDSRYKILRVPKATAMKRAMVADDPAIDEVFPIYRFADSDSAVISTGTIALRLRPDSDKYTLPKLLDDYRLTVVESVDGLDGTYIVRPSEEMGDEVLRAEVLAVDRRVLWAQPNFRSPVYFAQVSPSDPFFTRQWHLSNTGQMGGTPGADVNAPAAWLLGAEGQDVLIGMLDDACDVDHPDLVSNYLGIGHDPTEPSTAPGFDDPRPKVVGDRHGTAVMGLAVARANTLGVRGVSHLSQFTVSRGLGQLPTDAELANAYLFARQQDVDVHINSWGLGGGVPIPAIIEDAIETAFIEGRDLDGDGGDPPRGMIVLFASGNGVDRNGDGIIDNDGIGALLGPGDELSTLPTVIGVGATNDRDLIASYSNFGSQIDVLAPGGGDFAGITTTDVSDDGFIDGGFNIGGVNVSGETDIEGTGLYTGGFAGTSAACPIAAGVAALTLSISPLLSATDVHLILKHTSAKVSPNDAVYDDITSRSLRYGYGRVDAVAAVMAAQDSLSNGGRTWPSRPARTTVSNQTGQLTWLQNGDPLEFRGTISDNDPNSETENITVLRTTDEFLVLESDAPFVFLPEDGKCYSKEQIGCGSTEPEPLPLNVSVLRVGCSLVCGTGSTGLCEAGAPQCVGFLLPSGAKHFAIYARSNIGRYSFGVSVDTDGNILDSGELPPRAEAGTIPGGGGGVDADVGPKVSIEFSPREGESPLTVSFRGNAASVLPIDADRTAWDFDIDDGIVVDATTRNATNIYLLNPGETPTNQKTFIARLTMFDVEGNIGFAQAAISVTAAGIDPDTGADADAELRIIISTPGSVGSDIDSGQSPLRVELSVDAGSLVGTVESVFWDLGDGTTATSRFVSHTYVNNTGISLRIPITATVTIQTGSETSIRVVSRRVTVESGDPSDLTVNPDCTEADGCGATGPGGEATPCGVLNMVPLLFSLVSLLWIRRSRRSAF